MSAAMNARAGSGSQGVSSPGRSTAPGTTMGLRQYGIVLLCMFLNMTDGFDLFIVGFALPHLPEGFATAGEKGFVISLALVGMAIGAIFLARLADRFGRRATVLGGLVIDLLGLVVSALAVSQHMLMAGRFITGLGVGMVSVVIVVIAQEGSPPAKRNMSTGIVMFGFPMGSTVAGLVATGVLAAAGNAWQSLFWCGAGLAVIGLVVAYFAVPESQAFLNRTGRTPAGAGRRANTAPEAGTGAAASGAGTARASVANAEAGTGPATASAPESTALMGRSLWITTLMLATGYGMLSAAYYFVGTWTPQLITDLTGDQAAGATAGIVVSVGTFVGVILFSVLGLRFSSLKLTTVYLVVGALAVIGYSLLLPGPASNVFALLMGLAVFGAMSGYTAMVPTQYPVLARAKGYGMMLGVGRAGAIVAPILVGFAATAVDTGVIYFLAIIPVGFALLAAAVLLGRSKGRAVTAE